MDFHTFYHFVQTDVMKQFFDVDKWFDKPEALRSYKPNNGGWTIDEILEHIMLTNHYLLILIDKGKEKALKKTEKVDIEAINYTNERLSSLDEVGEHNSFPWHRPAHMEPTGSEMLISVRMKLKYQIKQCLYTLDALKEGQGTFVKTTMSVNDLGKLDVYEYIYFLSLHSKRHIEQMKKIELEFEQLVQ